MDDTYVKFCPFCGSPVVPGEDPQDGETATCTACGRVILAVQEKRAQVRRVQLNVRLGEDQLAGLQTCADGAGLTLSELARVAIGEYIANHAPAPDYAALLLENRRKASEIRRAKGGGEK
jgi:DNA-directed RNA polymerase subunit RPC12/RpoP